MGCVKFAGMFVENTTEMRGVNFAGMFAVGRDIRGVKAPILCFQGKLNGRNCFILI
jgi:hypothetical protein